MTTIPEFGIKRENEERRDGGCAIVFDPKTQLYAVGKQENNARFRLFSGGVDEGENIQEGILREVVEESGLNDFLHVEKIAQAFTHFHNTLKKVNRSGMATCLLVILKSRNNVGAKLEEHEKFSLEWDTSDAIISNWQELNEDKTYDHWIYFMKLAVERIKELSLTEN